MSIVSGLAQDERAITRRPAEIKRMVRAGELIRLRRGCYAVRGRGLTPEQRHRHLLEATRPTLAPDAVFTHVTAAVMHDLPVPIPSLARIHITREDGGGRVTANVCRHAALLVLIALLGLPMPDLQREFRTDHGEVDARVDFDWEEFGVCGEFDGEVKYGRLLKPGQFVESLITFENPLMTPE